MLEPSRNEFLFDFIFERCLLSDYEDFMDSYILSLFFPIALLFVYIDSLKGECFYGVLN